MGSLNGILGGSGELTPHFSSGTSAAFQSFGNRLGHLGRSSQKPLISIFLTSDNANHH